MDFTPVLLDTIAQGVQTALYGATLAIIIWGATKSLLLIFGCQNDKKDVDSSEVPDKARLQLSSALSMALSVLVAAEVIRILNIQTWEQLARVAAVIFLRHLLKRDLADEASHLRKCNLHKSESQNNT